MGSILGWTNRIPADIDTYIIDTAIEISTLIIFPRESNQHGASSVDDASCKHNTS